MRPPASSASGRSLRATSSSKQQGGEDPVAGQAVAAEDDVAGLLAAELEAVGLEGVGDVAVPDRRLDDPDAPRREGLAKAEVAHDRHDDRPAGEQATVQQVEGEHGEQLVAVDELAGVVDGEHPVGVAVEGDPEGRAGARRRPLAAAGGRSSRSRR